MPFDIVETYSYKLANHWGVSLDAIIVQDQLSFEPKFLNGVGFVVARLWNKPLMTIDQELIRLSQRRLSNIVLDTAIAEMMQFLLQEDPGIMTAPSYSADVADAVVMMIGMINAYPPSNGSMTFSSIRERYALQQVKLSIVLSEIRSVSREIYSTQRRYRAGIVSDVMRSSDLVVINESIRLVIVGDAGLSADDVTSQFDRLAATRYIRHIVCSSSTSIEQKIYVPKPLENLGVGRVINMATQLPSNTITFVVTAIASYEMTYYVDGGYIEGANIRAADRDRVIELCSEFLDVRLSTETWSIRCQARLYPTVPRPFQMMMHYLLHMTIVDPKVYQLRLDESTDPYPAKTEYIMRYKPAWTSSGIGFSHSIAKQESQVKFTCPRMMTGNNYIAIDIESFTLASIFRTLASLIPTLCLYYSEHLLNVSPLAALYDIPGLSPPEPRVGMPTKIAVAKQLLDEWPQVFTPAYLASVEGVKHLVRTTTNPLEAKEWESEVMIKEGKEDLRSVGRFPPTGVLMFWYTSISSSAPVVGLITNTEDVAPLYPHIPASFSSLIGVRSVNGSGKETGVSLKALRILGKEGDTPDSLDIVIGMRVKRSYTPVGVDSFVYAVMMAVASGHDEENTSVPFASVALAQSGMTAVREAMSALRPEVYMQQFYDVTRGDIIEKLRDPAEYIDPLLYCAGMEALFDVDIWVITPTTDKNVSTHRLEVPRYREFHCRSGRPRQCVIVYNNPGIKSDLLLHPHCEIVKDIRSGAAMFSTRVSARLLAIAEDSNNFMHSTQGGMHLSDCMRSSLYIALQSVRVVSQMIDSCGKARVITISSTGPNQQPVLVSLFCFPQAPLNVRSSPVIHRCTAEWFAEFCDSAPVGRSNIGLWSVHQASGVMLYVRTVQPPDVLVPFIDQDPLMLEAGQTSTSQGSSFVSISVARDRMAIIIRENLKWYFEVYSQYHRRIDVAAFLEECLGYVSPDQHEDVYYSNITSVTDILPRVTSLSDVQKHIATFVPQLDGARVLLHNEQYYRCMVYTLGKHANAFLLTDPLTARHHIRGFYSSLYGYRQHANTLIVSGRSNVAQLPQNKSTGHNNRVLAELRHTLLGSVDPLLYDNKGVRCVIQATQASNVGAAYTVCDSWNTLGKNSGYFSATSGEMPVPVVVYLLDDNELKPTAYLLEDKSVTSLPEDVEYYEMIFSNKKYFALLRLS